MGNNINGPSVIRVPPWLSRPLGKYYMYFAHHGGKFIRLAYADSLAGPWKVYEPGTLKLEQATAFTGHIASPDVHVDHEKKRIRMYFHGPAPSRKGQWTGVAVSEDGLNFKASDEILGRFYFRVFQKGAYYYALDGGGHGRLLRSTDPLKNFEEGKYLFEPDTIRHTALLEKDGYLLVFHSRYGHAPERILVSTVRLTPDWSEWTASDPLEVIRPEKEYEGTGYPLKPSVSGAAIEVCELRDPCIFEEDGRIYLFYSTAGEMGIALAELKITMYETGEPGR
ncbi:MAG: hypothetical protein GXY44_05945 [Phycisphaerales bacterium]|nr:hypothetical protein [Phycisphaerales bacterium]